jgi:hypothetical protein
MRLVPSHLVLAAALTFLAGCRDRSTEKPPAPPDGKPVTVEQTAAVDYGKVDRRLTKQPAYQTKKPRYALLLFGPGQNKRVGSRCHVIRLPTPLFSVEIWQ